jgi:DHA1 family inner membrane transport protein
MPRLLYLFALCYLVLGTGAFGLAGLLVPLAESLGVSVGAAGQAMTVYALSTAVLAPLALVLTGTWPRRQVLCLSMLLFALGDLVCALAPNLAVLLAGRVLMGVGAMFIPVAAGIAVALVEPARRGRALSLVFLGISLSYVIGVPLGAWLGFELGWRWPVAMLAAASTLGAMAIFVLAPRDIAAPGASFKGLSQLLLQREVAMTLCLTLLYFIAIASIFSYIGPVIQALSPMSTARLSLTLMLFGLAGAAGTVLGGWANDRFGPQRTLALQLGVLGSMMALLPFTQGHYAPMLAVLLVWGLAGFGMNAPQQFRLASLAPAQAPILLSLNTSMLYFGTALGAAVGGLALDAVGFAHLGWIGAPFAFAGMATLWISRRKPRLIGASG